MAEINRSLIAHFLNITPSATADDFRKIGSGVSALTMNYNAQTETEQYIHQDSATTTVSGYQPTVPVEQKCYPGDEVYDFIDTLRETLSVGGNDLTELVEVRLYKTPDTAGTTYPATQWNVAISFDTFGGDGGAKGVIGWTINVLGDPIPGTFNVSTRVWTAT